MIPTLPRRGSFFVPLVAAVILIFMLLGYITLIRYMAVNNETGVAKELGGKQAAILAAIQEGERIHSYAKIALQSARDEAQAKYLCGEEYLGRRLVSEKDCSETFTEAIDALFTERLTKYPSGSIADSFSTLTIDPSNENRLISTANRKIPIATGEISAISGSDALIDGYSAAGGTFSGSISRWPTDTKIINSYFGNRNVAVAGSTKNHPGIDIGTGGQSGQAIYSLTDGIAVFHDHGKDSYVQVTSGLVKIDYMHVRPVLPVVANKGVPVTAGQQIAVTGAYPGGAPHLHLQVSVTSISAGAAKKAFPAHVGPSNAPTVAPISYGVTRGDGESGVVYLNPICFFDRAFIDAVPRKADVKAVGDPYEACHAYEQAFGLAKRITSAAVVAEASPAPAPTPQVTPAVVAQPTTEVAAQVSETGPATSPASSKYPRVRETYANLQKRPEIMGYIDSASEATGVDKALLLAIITQESQGDPNARSTTGAAGIAQFTGGTAQGMAAFSKITYCCTAAQALAGTCRTVAACTPQNDDRFDPRKSIDAQAALLKDSTKKYASYDQRIPLILISYNAGGSVADQILKKTGPNPTWPQMKSVIQNDYDIKYGSNVVAAKKRIEVVGYVEAISKYVSEWGGVTLAGSSFTQQRVGEYDLRFSLSTEAIPKTAKAVESIKQEMEACTSQACLDAVISRAASANGVSITREDLATAGGCMSEREKAQAHLANQLEWCKGTADENCLCDLPKGRDATYAITAETSLLTKLGEEEVTARTMPGLSFAQDGDSGSLSSVKYYSGSDVTEDDSVTVQLSSEGSARIERTFGSDEVRALRKSRAEGGLSLTSETPDKENSCVLAQSALPQPYCIRSQDNSFAPVVFYLKPTFALEKPISIKQYEMRDIGGGSVALNAIILTDIAAPYARVRYTTPGEAVPRDEWKRVVRSERGLTQLLGNTFANYVIGLLASNARTIERTTLPLPPLAPNQDYRELYDVTVRPKDGETVTVTFFTEHMVPAGSIALDLSLTKEESGILLPTELLGGALTGGLSSVASSIIP